MKSKVLLIYLPGIEIGYGPIFPMGIGYLLSAIKQDREAMAVNYELMDHAFLKLPDVINSFQPDIIGLSCTTFNRGNISRFCGWVRKYYPHIKIIIGGVHASFFPKQMLYNYKSDYVVIGEGEQTLRELCDAIDEGDDLNKVKGIVYKGNYAAIFTEPREQLKDLDELQIPDFSYAENMMRKSGLGFIITSRGCPAHCNFCCTSTYWGQKVRMYSVKRVVNEIEIMINKYGVNKILFHDDTFNLSIKRVIEICDEIINRKLNITWAAACRVHPVSKEMIKKMVEAGCRHICWGVESGSEKMLKLIDKKITKEQIKNAYDLCKEYIGIISIGAFTMVGNPGESDETINESSDFINTLALTDSPGTAALYILPGTKVYEDLKAKNPDIDNFWLESEGMLRPPEYSLSQLTNWATKIARSGNYIPFDRSKHFFNNILFGNIPKLGE